MEESNTFIPQPREEARTWRTCSYGEPHCHLAAPRVTGSPSTTELDVHASPRLSHGCRGRDVFKPQALLQAPGGIDVHTQEAFSMSETAHASPFLPSATLCTWLYDQDTRTHACAELHLSGESVSSTLNPQPPGPRNGHTHFLPMTGSEPGGEL